MVFPVLLAVCGLMALLGWALHSYSHLGKPSPSRLMVEDPANPIPLQNFTPDKITPTIPEDAKANNRQQPVIGRVPVPASPFQPAFAASLERARAIDCLARAVYFEAGSESADGQRGVAQIVLNRVRHPAYPNTVCGVVYQGAARRTGCQFTFTCDGSLLRIPSTRGLATARAIAQAALSGAVFAPVGASTHYHADYVVPYWRSSLLKTAVVGTHIFYRSPGISGTNAGLVARYAGREPQMAGAPPADPAPVTAEAEAFIPANPALIAAPSVPEDRAEEIDSFAILDYRKGRTPTAPSAAERQADASVRSARTGIGRAQTVGQRTGQTERGGAATAVSDALKADAAKRSGD